MADKDPALGWCEHHQVYHRNFVCEFGGGVDADPPINYVRATERTEMDQLRAENATLRAQDPAISELVRASDAAHGEVVALEAENAALKVMLDKAELTLRDLAVDGANLSAVAANALARIHELKEKAGG